MFSSALSWPLLNQECLDPRIPYLSGHEVLFCDDQGLPTQIFNLESGAIDRFQHSVLWFSSKEVWVKGIDGGLKSRITQPSETPRHRMVFDPEGGPVFFEDASLAVNGSELVWKKGQVGQKTTGANAKSWQHPVLNSCGAFWIDRQEQIVWWKHDGSVERSSPKDYPRSLVGDGQWLAWAEDDRVWLKSCEDGEERSWVDRAIDRVTLDQGVLCWSFWNGEDADIRCSDGFVLQLEGDQTWPSLGDKWLIFRDQQGVRGVELPQ